MNLSLTMILLFLTLTFSTSFINARSAEIFRPPNRLARENDYWVRKPLFFPVSNLDSRRINRGFVSKSKRLRNEKQGMTNKFEITDEQVKQMKNELSIENYVESFIRTLFPELKGENGYWIIQQLTNDVVNEMNQLKKTELEGITNDILPLFQGTA